MRSPISWMLMALLFVLSSAIADPVYRVVQEDGTLLYTSEPQPGAVEVMLDGTTKNAVPPLSSQTATRVKPLPATKAQPDVQISILSPAPEATIRDNQGNIVIKAQATANARGQYQLWLDGEAVKTNQTGIFALQNVDRGAHDYQVRFIDNKGKTLASSPQQTLYLHQASALINTNRQ
ncbi:DUF4124 domain-containing protein [Alteromonas ponticola]|uniref:DUF4124 domain-containing protein n=1 Tax=Alteromonas aquimaris TaxID=2998417 RepID=A0ABT3P3Z5_9ALTE|nr:DUF4124 domain-containing protein [Alteromonas aquimaris]MCW8107485.1 DUF4124 domain-containing protein [Alteromonas aquimaris]